MDNQVVCPYRTETNDFGLYRIYPGGRPSYTPDGAVALFQPSDSPTLTTHIKPKPTVSQDIIPDIDYAEAPFNRSQHLLIDWHWNEDTSNKTLGSADRLVHDVLQHPDFKKEEIMGWRGMARETQIMEDYLNDPNMTMPVGDKWIKASVDIPIPSTKVRTTEDKAAAFTVDGIFYRRPLDVIKNKLKTTEAQSFHLFPFQEYWESPSGATPSIRTSDELYNSDTWISEHLKVQEDARTKGITLETVLIGLQFWSDSTLLANFGDAALWPLYMEEANLPKSIRMAASSGSMHHIAHVPKLDDTFEEWYDSTFGANASKEHLAFLRKEIYHAVWDLILDADFMHAYFHGFEWKFWDAIIRLVFPRVFTHSADYPEKLLIACLRYFATCPCPRCLMPKTMIYKVGSDWDRKFRAKHPRVDTDKVRSAIQNGREWIFHGSGWKNQNIESTLSKRLGPAGFNFYDILVFDVLHVFELGVWKAVLSHLLRMLHSRGKAWITKLNQRYGLILE
ncbi:hypothetical protein BKA70DRAFT_1111955 [Coprinopsis sp. MPI-PUGE-AT-0042]|nr:hypothetical protein BKA70DRAFT_1111955 [Coprinopsis sp. MPI-PUGE-AT-0042]